VALTPESVVQMAVANLGETTTVSDITTSPSTKAEKFGQLFYTVERDRINAKHNWSWATRRAALTDVTSTQAKFGWSYAYTLPADILRVIGIDLGYRSGPDAPGLDPVNPTLPGASWAIEMNAAGTARILLCDIEAASLAYVARVTDLTLWDPDAVEALVWGMSFRLAMPLSVKADYATLAKQMSEEKLNRAIADDANEAHPDHLQTSEIVTSRAW
jgi:hypothetical protein